MEEVVHGNSRRIGGRDDGRDDVGDVGRDGVDGRAMLEEMLLMEGTMLVMMEGVMLEEMMLVMMEEMMLVMMEEMVLMEGMMLVMMEAVSYTHLTLPTMAVV